MITRTAVELAMRYLAEANRCIGRQQNLIRRLVAAGQSTDRAETLLEAMLQALETMHQQIIHLAAEAQEA